MIAHIFRWRSYTRDKIFIFLFSLTILTFILALAQRHPSLETTPIPFNLTFLFVTVNVLFALLTLKREPLLCYMFLTATILMNSTLLFYFRYLNLIQAG